MSDTKSSEVMEDTSQGPTTTPRRRQALGTSRPRSAADEFPHWFAELRERGMGDFGTTPIVLTLAVIWVVFALLDARFVSPDNLVNLTLQSASLGTIALGVVFVLLIGQIDLSIGSTSGVAAAIVGVAFVHHDWPIGLAIVAGIAVGVVIGISYGILFTRFGVPSFVITLAGLMGLLGLQLRILGDRGSIQIPFDSWLVRFAQNMFLPAWFGYLIAIGAGVAYFVTRYRTARMRRAAGLSSRLFPLLILHSTGISAVLVYANWYLNTDRGVGLTFVFFLALVLVANYVLTRTTMGRAIFAVGGNVDAARRAGINVTRIQIMCFALGAGLAAVGGILAAARIASASQTTGGGETNLTAIAAAVIGGTSLFGGRGSAWSAFLGVLVIGSIASGLTLLSPDSSARFIVTGAVLLLAVIADSLSRKSRVAHGRG